MTSMTTLRRILQVLNDSVDVLEARGTAIPDLHAAFSPASEAFRSDPEAAEAAKRISAAALHLEAIMTPPQVSLYHIVAGHFKSAALQVCLESHVTEILREAGPKVNTTPWILLKLMVKGLHVDEIASINGQDPLKLVRFLRYLATQHVYREVTPNVFANTRISSMLDTMKPVKDILADPASKHDDTPGLVALAAHHLDEGLKASACAWDTLSDPTTSHSSDPAISPFSRAFGIKGTMWDLHVHDERRARRFNIGMRGVQGLQPRDAILFAYDWETLPPQSIIVDVGGGVGTSSLVLAKNFPSLHLVVQDLKRPIDDAQNIWKSTLPNATVTLEVQDFFTPQPKDRPVSVFLLKQILHDWSDEYCIKLLTHLRTAASADTKLILVESILPFACHDNQTEPIPGALPKEAPEPLLANYGAVNEMGYNADMAMFILHNAQERTIRHTMELLWETGWQAKRVRRHDGDSTFLQSVEAIPVFQG